MKKEILNKKIRKINVTVDLLVEAINQGLITEEQATLLARKEGAKLNQKIDTKKKQK
jgi:hypothetical protein